MSEFNVGCVWTGNLGSGTSGYRNYSRDHEIRASGKPALSGSSAPEFRGDAARYNPEELLLAALSSCHMLWFLHLCSDAGIAVTAYSDDATAKLTMHRDGSGEFESATLRPDVTLHDASRAPELERLHHRAHDLCFIARSVKFPVTCLPVS